jgi:hypothetical protein
LDGERRSNFVFGIRLPADDRRDYVRLDRAKINVARTSGPTTWFKLVGVQIGNATETYPAGDSVQTVGRRRRGPIWMAAYSTRF